MLRCDQCDGWDNGICTNRDSDRCSEETEPGEWCLDYEPKGERDE